jgi:hypothetical protein
MPTRPTSPTTTGHRCRRTLELGNASLELSNNRLHDKKDIFHQKIVGTLHTDRRLTLGTIRLKFCNCVGHL